MDMTPAIAQIMGVKETKGSLVTQVDYGSPAHKAGIRGGYITANVGGVPILLGGDIISRVDNATVNTTNDLVSYLSTKKVEDTVQITVARDNAIKNIALVLSATPPPSISQPSGPKLQLLGMNTFIDTNEFNPGLHIVGEVLNNGTEPATSIAVSATLYDITNQVVGTGFTYTSPSYLEPGKKVPFEILVSKNNFKGGDFRNINHVSVQAG
jgi:PDZ domain